MAPASAPGFLLAIALGKILTTRLTIGSGGSGGVFGPSMVIGGCGGGALGMLLHHFWPSLVPHPASFVIVGMAGFFAAAAKTPFSTLIIVSEMTGGYTCSCRRSGSACWRFSSPTRNPSTGRRWKAARAPRLTREFCPRRARRTMGEPVSSSEQVFPVVRPTIR